MPTGESVTPDTCRQRLPLLSPPSIEATALVQQERVGPRVIQYRSMSRGVAASRHALLGTLPPAIRDDKGDEEMVAS